MKGRRGTPNPLAMAAEIRAREAAEKRKRGEAIKFHCSRCRNETTSGVAKGTLCPDCWVADEFRPDAELYVRTTVKMARMAEAGLDTRKQFAQTMRIHDRMVRRLAQAGVSEKKAGEFVDHLLERSKAAGGRIVVPKMDELLSAMGVKVEK